MTDAADQLRRQLHDAALELEQLADTEAAAVLEGRASARTVYALRRLAARLRDAGNRKVTQ